MTLVGLAAITAIVAIVALVVLDRTGGSGDFEVKSGDSTVKGHFDNRSENERTTENDGENDEERK